MRALRQAVRREKTKALIQAIFVLYKQIQSFASCTIRTVPVHWRILGNIGARIWASGHRLGTDAAEQ